VKVDARSVRVILEISRLHSQPGPCGGPECNRLFSAVERTLVTFVICRMVSIRRRLSQ